MDFIDSLYTDMTVKSDKFLTTGIFKYFSPFSQLWMMISTSRPLPEPVQLASNPLIVVSHH